MPCIYRAPSFKLKDDFEAPPKTQDLITKLSSECKEIRISEYYYSWTSIYIGQGHLYLARFKPTNDTATTYSFMVHDVKTLQELKTLFITKHDVYNSWKDKEAISAFQDLINKLNSNGVKLK